MAIKMHMHKMSHEGQHVEKKTNKDLIVGLLANIFRITWKMIHFGNVYRGDKKMQMKCADDRCQFDATEHVEWEIHLQLVLVLCNSRHIEHVIIPFHGISIYCIEFQAKIE